MGDMVGGLNIYSENRWIWSDDGKASEWVAGPCEATENKHRSGYKKDTRHFRCAFVGEKDRGWIVTRGGHTTRTQDEASREGGRDCGCVVGVVGVGFGGDRGRRGG